MRTFCPEANPTDVYQMKRAILAMPEQSMKDYQ
jgi:hypothetical protein